MIDLSNGREQRIPRAEIAAAMRQHGIPSGIASEAADLAAQAATGALDHLLRTVEMASTPAGRMNALSVAIALARQELDVLGQAMNFVKAQCGVATVDVTVERAHG